MRVLWDTNVVVAGLVFARGQAAQALYSGWERWPQLLITQWIDAEARPTFWRPSFMSRRYGPACDRGFWYSQTRRMPR